MWPMLGGHRQCTPLFFCYWNSFETSGPTPGITPRTRRGKDRAALCLETTDGLGWLRNAPGSFVNMQIPGGTAGILVQVWVGL